MTTWQDIDFARAGQLTTAPETVGTIISLLTASKDEHEGSLIDLEALVSLAADPEHAIAAIQFLLGIVLAALTDLEQREGLSIDRWLQRMALHYS